MGSLNDLEREYYEAALAGTLPSADVGTGWGFYSDTQYTEASPLVVTAGSRVALPNNKGTVIESHLPTGITTLYDGTRITPQKVGDGYELRIGFKAKTSSNNGGFLVDLDISAAGDGSNVILERSSRFLRGTNTEQKFSFTSSLFSLNTFVANGGLLTFESITGNSSIYEINYLIKKDHDA